MNEQRNYILFITQTMHFLLYQCERHLNHRFMSIATTVLKFADKFESDLEDAYMHCNLIFF